jgi:glyoxylase I family protein
MPGIHHAAICTADVERSMKFWRDGLGFTELFDHPPQRPRHGFFLLSRQRDVDETLSALAALGFADGVRRISMQAPGRKTVPMAVITAPDGVLVELIGDPQ